MDFVIHLGVERPILELGVHWTVQKTRRILPVELCLSDVTTGEVPVSNSTTDG